MVEIVRPGWEDLREVVNSAEGELTICTPYFSKEGVGKLFDYLEHKPLLLFWTAIRLGDWVEGASDPGELATMLSILLEDGFPVELGVNQQLHGKAYISDKRLTLVGSANLSAGGFATNTELMVKFVGEEAEYAANEVSRICRPRMRIVEIEEIGKWAEESEEIISDIRRRSVNQPEELKDINKRLYKILGLGGAPRLAREPTDIDMMGFVEWLEANLGLPGASVINERRTNADHNNLQGHFKQSFFGALRFLKEHPEYIDRLNAALGILEPNDIYRPDSDLLNDWITHLNGHATDESEEYSYPTLLGILPTSLGGTVSNGGGASSTFKRMLPIVARFMEEGGSG